MAAVSSPDPKTKSPARSKNEAKATKKRAQADGDNGGNQSQPKRNKAPGVRVVGNRIYDSVTGKTCHQVFPFPLFPIFAISDFIFRSNRKLFFLPRVPSSD